MSKQSGSNMYQKGTAMNLAFKERPTFGQSYPNATGLHEALLRLRDAPKVGGLGGQQFDADFIRLWQGALVRFGRNLDQQVDELATQVIIYQDSWRSSRKPIASVLDNLLKYRKAIRNFEEEVEDFMLIVTTQPDSAAYELSNIPMHMLGELHGTYHRTFDLCALKLNNINSGRVTFTNFMLSGIALIVAVISLMVAL